jgi:hypothetical protein
MDFFRERDRAESRSLRFPARTVSGAQHASPVVDETGFYAR